VDVAHGFRSPAAHYTGGYGYSTATRSEEGCVRIMAHRVVVEKKPANKIGRLNMGEIAAVALLLRNDGGGRGGGRWIRYRGGDRGGTERKMDWLSRLWASLRVPLSRE
jgi:hypothetical protein